MELIADMAANPTVDGDDVEALPVSSDRWDSNAELSVVPWELELIGRLLSRSAAESDDDGSVVVKSSSDGPSAVMRAMQALLAALAMLAYPSMLDHYLSRSGMADSTPLMRFSSALLSVAIFMLVPAYESVRAALCAGGALEQLGAGTVRIGASEARSLRRWRVGLAVLMGFASLGTGTYAAVAMGPMQAVACCLIFPPNLFIFHGWWLSMRLGSCLARDETVEVMRATADADPTDEAAWTADVARRALALDEVFRQLSAGWGVGLQALVACFWVMVLCFVSVAVDNVYLEAVDTNQGYTPGTVRYILLLSAAFDGILPLFFLADVAVTSSYCDKLTATLTQLGAKCYGNERATTLVLQLNTLLNEHNRKQGLGLVLWGTVVDRRTLGRLFTGIVGIMASTYTALLSLSTAGATTSNVHPTVGACQAMTSEQHTMADELFGMVNASCNFNFTVGKFTRVSCGVSV